MFFSFILSFHLQCCLYSLQGQTCSFHQPHARKQQLPILITPSPRIVFCLLFIASQSVTTLVSCNLLESWYHLVNLITVKLVYVVCYNSVGRVWLGRSQWFYWTGWNSSVVGSLCQICGRNTWVSLIWIGSSELTLTLCGNGKECMWNIHNAYGTNTVKKWSGIDWHKQLEEGSESMDGVQQLCFLTNPIMQMWLGTYTHTIYRLFPFILWTSGIPKSFSLISSVVAALHISRYFLLMGQQANIKVCYKFSKTTSETYITSDCSRKWCCISYVCVKML